MFYPIITSLQLEEARNRDGLKPVSGLGIQIRSNHPTRWDYFLLNFGGLLIQIGNRVRSNSYLANCGENNALKVRMLQR
jgi:hypothetical protein